MRMRARGCRQRGSMQGAYRRAARSAACPRVATCRSYPVDTRGDACLGWPHDRVAHVLAESVHSFISPGSLLRGEMTAANSRLLRRSRTRAAETCHASGCHYEYPRSPHGRHLPPKECKHEVLPVRPVGLPPIVARAAGGGRALAPGRRRGGHVDPGEQVGDECLERVRPRRTGAQTGGPGGAARLGGLGDGAAVRDRYRGHRHLRSARFADLMRIGRFHVRFEKTRA